MAALDGVVVIEFGAGAAGPLAARMLADLGARVIRVESRTRPDFLRLYGQSATQRSLDAAPMFAAFNANKTAVTLNMKHPEARDIALRLIDTADIVIENFAAGAMARMGLADLLERKPSLVVVSTCMHGHTGPEKDYPGFGGQGAALSGFDHATRYPDAEPLGPYGTITDSLAPRFAAAAALAALYRARRTGQGAVIDISQVETAIYSLAPMLLDESPEPVPLVRRIHRCDGDDRWIAITCWSVEQAETLTALAGDDIEAWVRDNDRDVLARLLREAGIEATPVADLGEVYEDEALRGREHFVRMSHPVIGEHDYEAMGFRLEDSPMRWRAPGPTLGRDNDEVYGALLTPTEYARLRADGCFD